MRKKLKMIILLVTIVVLVWAFVKVRNMPSLSALFTPKKVIIENSPIVVKQIQALAQLVTVSMYNEIVTDTSKADIQNIQLPFLPSMHFYKNQDRLVVIGKVSVHAGIDMQQLNEGSISGTTDSLHLLLPPAQILDAVINPSGVEVFIEDGEWNGQSVNNLKNKIQEIAIAEAQSRGLLAQSQNKAAQILKDFFTAAGYKKVAIDFKRKPASLR